MGIVYSPQISLKSHRYGLLGEWLSGTIEVHSDMVIEILKSQNIYKINYLQVSIFFAKSRKRLYNVHNTKTQKNIIFLQHHYKHFYSMLSFCLCFVNYLIVTVFHCAFVFVFDILLSVVR